MKKLPISLLFIEYNLVLRSVYQHILQMKVETLYLAANGEEGYNMYEKYKPDLIITNIKMPVTNGLDMIRKIRRKDKKVRFLILSAYNESRYLFSAIELGVKGYMLKTFDSKKILSLIEEQVEEITLEWKMEEEEKKRSEAEHARMKSDAILRTLAYSTASFFHHGFNSSNVNPVLKSIGLATESSRVYIFHNFKEGKQKYTSQIYEWTAKEITAEINNPDLQHVPLDSHIMTEWVSIMQNGGNVVGLVDDFNSEELRQVLNSQNIISILVIPIFVNQKWWGFIGLDDCVNERAWSDAEIKALEALANNLGAAIYRRNVELELLELNASLEKRVKKRTHELEMEVSERKMAELLLRDSEEKYRLIFENANSGILLILNEIIVLVNPKTVDIFGYLPKDMIGKPLSVFIHRKQRNRVKKCFELKNYDVKCLTLDVQIITKNGNAKWTEIKSNEIIWDNENSYLIFISDISLRKNAEESLNQLNKNLELRIREKIAFVKQQQQMLMQKSKLESMGELAAGLAHEINQPLVGISMGLDNVLMKLSDPSINKTYIRKKFDYLFKDIDRINQIIQHVRIFSRDQEFTVFDKIDIIAVIENALSMIRIQLSNHEIELKIKYSENELFTLGNQYRLEQVILNILSNAKYAVEEKEKIGKTGGFRKRIEIKCFSDNEKAKIVIKDNGIGIPPEVILNVFNPFFTTKNEEKGTGLGLSISYGIVKEMKGDIFVESELNKFSTFTIEFPLVKN